MQHQQMEIESGRPAEVHKTSCCGRYVDGAGQRDVVKIAFDLSWVRLATSNYGALLHCINLISSCSQLHSLLYSQQAVNILLLLAKIYAFATTGSKAVAASLADSGVDILSQIVLGLSTHLMHKKHEDYPVGRHRLEQLGVIACSCIMSIAALEVIQFAIGGELMTMLLRPADYMSHLYIQLAVMVVYI
jgi:Cation efflux family